VPFTHVNAQYPAPVAFRFSDRVVLTDTPHNREGGHVGAAGLVTGISYEHEDQGEHVGYAVMLDADGMTHFVLPDGLALERA
jgi:hypothetical protein